MKLSRLVLILFLFNQCEPSYYNKYVVRNETAHSISIQGYSRIPDEDYGKKSEKINISPNSSYTDIKQAGYHAEPEGIFIRFEIDSVSISFDNKKVLVLFCSNGLLRDCDVERNIMNFESEYHKKLTGRSSGHNEYQFTYIITDKDYENATYISN